ncbi:D-aminoacyl-tRNA deacylase [uncultured Winogradskyella sp.]|uniref:D-aminoacyl-tRNA deacylase n=1 Tax=uncultured Winogradskyella sp. TaxID=395353 RepID=UPI0030D8E8A7|tara:strand:+ start:122825 stop:123277 length:453 start_codon:yes stop_codon:yes gene_type:complete
MKTVIQRVSEAAVEIGKVKVTSINKGLLILLGIEDSDTSEDINWLCKKIINLRIFSDQDGVMNTSIKDTNGAILLVSQFTLYASTKKGNRPSYIKAAKPDIAIPLYKNFIETLQIELKKTIQTGVFGADMKVHLVNDGPVTILIDSKDKV